MTRARLILILGVATILYFVDVLSLHCMLPIQMDEVSTYYHSRPDMPFSMTEALRIGTDATTLPCIWLERMSLSLLGGWDRLLALRAPSLVAGWAAMILLFWHFHRRYGWVVALASTACFIAGRPFYYFVEARPYSLSLLSGVLVLLSFERMARPNRASVVPILFLLSLWCALCAQPVNILLWPILGLAGIVRSIRIRSIDIAYWATLSLGLFPFPLLTSHTARIAEVLKVEPWAPVAKSQSWTFYYWALNPLIPIWLLAVLGFLAYLAVSRLMRGLPRGDDEAPQPVDSRARVDAFDTAEVIVLEFGMLLVPAIGVVAAKLTTGVYVYRYGLLATLSVASLQARSLDLTTRACRAMKGLCTALAAALFIPFYIYTNYYIYDTTMSNRIGSELARLKASYGPVACATIAPAWYISYYHERTNGKDVVYLTGLSIPIDDFNMERILPLLGTDVVCPLEDFRGYLERHRSFILVGNTFPQTLERLKQSGCEVVSIQGDWALRPALVKRRDDVRGP